MMIVEMVVHMDYAGCETKIKDALRNLEGVDDVDVNMSMQKVTVKGWAEEEKVLKTVRSTGRKAELWPYQYTPKYDHNLINLQYNNINDQMVEMMVHMDCAGCEAKIKKALRKLKGVHDVDVNMSKQKVTVMGWAEEGKVLKTVRRTGRMAELWPYPYTPENHHNLINLQYNNTTSQQLSSISLSNYNQNGFKYINNGNGYNYQHQSSYSSATFPFEFDTGADSMFSDENPHSCSIM